MTESARQRWWLGGFALATGLVLALPFLLMPLQRGFFQSRFPAEAAAWPLNGSFSALESFHMDVDEYPYAARMRQAATHLVPGDPHIKENRSARLAVRDAVPYQVLALFYRLAGGDPSRAWVLAQLVLSALWVPLLYKLLRAAGTERGPALALAVIATLFNDLTRLPFGGGLRSIAGAAAQYSLWPLGSYNYWFGPTRFTRPLLTYPFLFLAAVLAARAAETRTARAAVFAGLAGGLLAYVHPDVWAIYVGATGLFTLALCWRERAAIRPLLASLGVTAALSGPWLWLSFSKGEDAGLAAHILTRQPDAKGLLYAGLAALAFRLKGGAMTLWLGWLLVGIAVLLNLQVLLGFQGANPSLWWYLGNTFGGLVLGRLLSDRLALSAAGWRWLAACALLAALPRAVSYSAQHYKLYALPRDEQQALRWLDEHAAKDSVVAALSPLTVMRLPIYTPCKTLTAMIFPLSSDLSFRENARRLHAALSLYGADPKRFVDQGFDRSSDWERKLWHGEVDLAGHERGGRIERYFLEMSDPKKFSETLALAALDERDYRADYLWVGPFERSLMGPGGRLPARLAPKEVFSNSTFKIYALSPRIDLAR